MFRILKFILKSKHAHFLSVSIEDWNRYSLLIRLAVWINPEYVPCVIFRKKYKALKNIVVVGLKWNGKNVKRRTTGYAKDFLKRHRKAECLYCGTKLNKSNATADHIVPISKGGNNCQVNLIVCCFDCNNERGDMGFRKYLKLKNSKWKGIKFI